MIISATFYPMGILLIELEDEVLEWKTFEYFANLISNHTLLAEYAFYDYKESTRFINCWSRYINSRYLGIPTHITFDLNNEKS